MAEITLVSEVLLEARPCSRGKGHAAGMPWEEARSVALLEKGGEGGGRGRGKICRENT